MKKFWESKEPPIKVEYNKALPAGLILETNPSIPPAVTDARYNVEGFNGSIASVTAWGVLSPLFTGIHVCPLLVLFKRPSGAELNWLVNQYRVDELTGSKTIFPVFEVNDDQLLPPFVLFNMPWSVLA